MPDEDGNPRGLEVDISRVPVTARVSVLDPKTFRATPPPPAPASVLVGKSDVMQRYDLAEEAFDAALRTGFPAVSSTRVSTDADGRNTWTPLWREDDVEK